MTERAYILSGSNLGDRGANLAWAAELLEARAGLVLSRSQVYQSLPWGYESPKAYLNQALCLETDMGVEALLACCLGIEAELGRMRAPGGYADRVIDLDILFFGQLILEVPGLSLPHPRLQLRRFVLLPLAEIAAGLVHPVFGTSVGEMLEGCPDTSEVVVFKGEGVNQGDLL